MCDPNFHKPVTDLHSVWDLEPIMTNIRRNGSVLKIVYIVFSRIFGSKSYKVTRVWRKLHNEKLNGLYPSPNIVWVIKSRRMRWAGHVARVGKKIGVYRVLVGKLEGKRPLGRPMRRWEDNIKMDLQEVG